MKCIKVGEEIKKFKDSIAIDMFHVGKGKLVAKHFYKEVHGKGVSETSAKVGSKSQLKKKDKKDKEIMK